VAAAEPFVRWNWSIARNSKSDDFADDDADCGGLHVLADWLHWCTDEENQCAKPIADAVGIYVSADRIHWIADTENGSAVEVADA
jgi:hypothetical protein